MIFFQNLLSGLRGECHEKITIVSTSSTYEIKMATKVMSKNINTCKVIAA